MILISNSFVILARTKFLYFFSKSYRYYFSKIQRESTIDNRSGRNDRVQPFERLFRFFFLIFQYRVEELRFREVKLFWWERFLLREFILIYFVCFILLYMFVGFHEKDTRYKECCFVETVW